MKVQMQVVSGAKAQKVTLRLPTIIGRAHDARLKLRDSKVSRHHCELYEYEGQLAVRDLGSSNGTIVNGHRVEDPVLIETDDTLTVGPVTFRPLIGPVDPAAADTDIQEEPPQSESDIDYDETDEGSFIGIRGVDGGAATPAVARDERVDLAGDNVDDVSPVDPGESNLDKFLKGLE